MTDIGAACDHVIRNFGLCHAVFLEANYDEEMLETGHYPIYLKNRIRGDHGHLSNHQALEIFTKYKSEMLSHLLLSHLSRDNNNPHLVETLFNSYAGGTHIAIASRYQESPVYCITGEVNHGTGKRRNYPEKYIQQTLF
jgi:phosphoribosyl 1,2-cyclic phosphodiesterase